MSSLTINNVSCFKDEFSILSKNILHIIRLIRAECEDIFHFNSLLIKRTGDSFKFSTAYLKVPYF